MTCSFNHTPNGDEQPHIRIWFPSQQGGEPGWMPPQPFYPGAAQPPSYQPGTPSPPQHNDQMIHIAPMETITLLPDNDERRIVLILDNTQMRQQGAIPPAFVMDEKKLAQCILMLQIQLQHLRSLPIKPMAPPPSNYQYPPNTPQQQ